MESSRNRVTTSSKRRRIRAAIDAALDFAEKEARESVDHCSDEKAYLARLHSVRPMAHNVFRYELLDCEPEQPAADHVLTAKTLAQQFLQADGADSISDADVEEALGCIDRLLSDNENLWLEEYRTARSKGGRPSSLLPIDGSLVKAMRSRHGLTQRMFSRSTKVSVDVIQRAEKKGEATDATITQFVDFAKKKNFPLSKTDLLKK